MGPRRAGVTQGIETEEGSTLQDGNYFVTDGKACWLSAPVSSPPSPVTAHLMLAERVAVRMKSGSPSFSCP